MHLRHSKRKHSHMSLLPKILKRAHWKRRNGREVFFGLGGGWRTSDARIAVNMKGRGWGEGAERPLLFWHHLHTLLLHNLKIN